VCDIRLAQTAAKFGLYHYMYAMINREVSNNWVLQKVVAIARNGYLMNSTLSRNPLFRWLVAFKVIKPGRIKHNLIH